MRVRVQREVQVLTRLMMMSIEMVTTQPCSWWGGIGRRRMSDAWSPSRVSVIRGRNYIYSCACVVIENTIKVKDVELSLHHSPAYKSPPNPPQLPVKVVFV